MRYLDQESLWECSLECSSRSRNNYCPEQRHKTVCNILITLNYQLEDYNWRIISTRRFKTLQLLIPKPQTPNANFENPSCFFCARWHRWSSQLDKRWERDQISYQIPRLRLGMEGNTRERKTWFAWPWIQTLAIIFYVTVGFANFYLSSFIGMKF